MSRHFRILFLLFSLPGVMSSQEVKINASFDTTRIFLGDQVKYIVTLEKPETLRINLPVFKDTLLKQIEILHGPVMDSAAAGNGFVRIKHEYLVTSFDSGFYQVPPVYAELKTGSGVRRYYSDYAWLEVMRVKITPPDTASGIFDIVEPLKIPVTAGEIIPWILLTALLIIVIWLTVRLIKRYRKVKPEDMHQRPSEPAHVIAFRELENLKMMKLWQKGETKEYYSRLTEIIRQYLYNRFSVESMEMTTPETLAVVEKSVSLDDSQFRILRTILTGGDLVKFAKYNPEPSENELHFDYAWDFVKATMQIPVSDEDKGISNVKGEEEAK